MDDNLREHDFCFAYLEEVLILFRSLEEHERHLRALSDRLQTYGIITDPTKFIFRAQVNFLGYKVWAEGYRMMKERVSNLQDCPLPNSASQLRCFLGMLNFYRRYLPDAVAIQAPLTDGASDPRFKGSHSFTWTLDL
jgi:hypothetical protein